MERQGPGSGWIRNQDEHVAVIAHEIKTPLTALGLNLELLGRQLDPRFEGPLQDAPSAGACLNLCKAEVHRLNNLLNELLDFSLFRLGKLTLKKRKLDLVKLTQNIISLVTPGAEDRTRSIRLTAPARVTGVWDPSRIEQVITNLLSNAIKYGENKRIEVQVDSDEYEARITVQDHGLGIEPLLKAHIFDPFERIEDRRIIPGTGLGLSICRMIVEAHGGTIDVNSRVGDGSTFIVRLPVDPSVSSST